jgi:hypothetical protein
MGALARSLKKRWVHRNKEEREREIVMYWKREKCIGMRGRQGN